MTEIEIADKILDGALLDWDDMPIKSAPYSSPDITYDTIKMTEEMSDAHKAQVDDLVSKLAAQKEIDIQSDAPTPVPLQTESTPKRTRPLIDADIKLLEEKLGLPHKANLSKLKKKEALQYLADLMAKCTSTITDEELGLKESVSKMAISTTINKLPNNSAPEIPINDAIDILHRFNFIASVGIEKVSIVTRAKTGVSLEGYGRGIDQDKESLRGTYERIYRAHGVILRPYLTPLNELIGYHVMKMSSVAAENKKKDNSKQHHGPLLNGHQS